MKFRQKIERRTPNGYVIGGIYEGCGNYVGYHWKVTGYRTFGNSGNGHLIVEVIKNAPYDTSGRFYFHVGVRDLTSGPTCVSRKRVR